MSQQSNWSVTGLVVRGDQRGRVIGFPTANLQISESATLPRDGIYAGLVRCLDGPALISASAISVGTNPTFDCLSRTVEAHLLDFDGDLYGRHIEVRAICRLREMTRFPDVEALVKAISADVEATRRLVKLE